MKLNGQKIDAPNLETVVIPRANGADIVFMCGAVLDFAEFEAICPPPKPRYKTTPGSGVSEALTEEKPYKEALHIWARKQQDYITIKSLLHTPGLEFESVDMANPETYNNVFAELRTSGFSPSEINAIMDGVFTANGMDEKKLAQARELFLAAQKVATPSK